MISKKSDRLLETNVHTLASNRRFSQPSARTTLDGEIDPEWTALFERSETEEQWNTIMRCAEHLPSATYLAAKAACRGRDSKSKRIAAHRQECADFLDSL